MWILSAVAGELSGKCTHSSLCAAAMADLMAQKMVEPKTGGSPIPWNNKTVNTVPSDFRQIKDFKTSLMLPGIEFKRCYRSKKQKKQTKKLKLYL